MFKSTVLNKKMTIICHEKLRKYAWSKYWLLRATMLQPVFKCDCLSDFDKMYVVFFSVMIHCFPTAAAGDMEKNVLTNTTVLQPWKRPNKLDQLRL